MVAPVARSGSGHPTSHDLRDETASRLFEKELNPIEVTPITGHKTFQMLKQVYASEG